MGQTDSTLRAAALIAAASLALHELRYAVGYSGHASQAGDVHAYVPFVGVGVAVLLALAGARFVRALATARLHSAARAGSRGLALLWPALSATLLAIFLAQELAESALSGHAGSAPLGSQGGGVTLALAVAIGGLVALVLRSARRILAAAGRRAPEKPRRARQVRRSHLLPARPRTSLLARHLASRAPPLSS